MNHNINTHGSNYWITAIALLLLLFTGLMADRDELIENSSVCLDCHEEMDKSLELSAHRLVNDLDLGSALQVGCTSCHAGWLEHVDDPSAENIQTITELGGLEQARVCATCHQGPHQTAMITTDPHGLNGLGCSDCHQIHNNNSMKLTKDDDQEFCQSCHLNIAAQFKNRSSHPLESGNILCTDCHDLGGIENTELAVGLDWKCQECHPDQAGPFMYDHPSTFTHLVDGAGCSECHNPHGSPNDYLLKQPESGTCIQCHSTPPAHRIAHTGLGTWFACLDCHTEVHGSDHNRYLLDPDLNTKTNMDCYQSGCHKPVN